MPLITYEYYDATPKRRTLAKVTLKSGNKYVSLNAVANNHDNLWEYENYIGMRFCRQFMSCIFQVLLMGHMNDICPERFC